MISIAILDDHPAILKSIKDESVNHNQMEVVVVEKTFAPFRNALETGDIMMAIVDIIMDDTDGLEHIQQLIKSFPHIDFVAYTCIRDLKLIQQLYSIGVRGYLHKSHEVSELFKAVRQVFEGTLFIPEQLNGLIRHQKVEVPILSSREKVIMKHLIEGRSTGEIASLEFISENTVAFHRKNLFKKLGSPNAAAFTRDAIFHGLYKG